MTASWSILERGTLSIRPHPRCPTNTVGWASADQMIVIAGTEDEQTLQAIDPFTGSVNNVARVRGPAIWRATTANSNCSR